MTENQATSSNSQQVSSDAPIKRLEEHISIVSSVIYEDKAQRPILT